MFCGHLLSPFDLCCSLTILFIWGGLDDLQIGENGLLESLTIIIVRLMCSFMLSCVHLVKLRIPMFVVFLKQLHPLGGVFPLPICSYLVVLILS